MLEIHVLVPQRGKNALRNKFQKKKEILIKQNKHNEVSIKVKNLFKTEQQQIQNST